MHPRSPSTQIPPPAEGDLDRVAWPLHESERQRDAEDTAPPRSRRGRRAGLVLLGLVVSAFFAWLASRKISLAEVGDSLASADYVWLAPAIALTLVGTWVRAVRWRMLFADPDAVEPRYSFGALSIGLMFNNLLPSRAGEVPRVFALRRASGLSAFEIGTTIAVERVLDVFALALAGVMLWPFLPDRAWIDVLGVVCAGIVAGCVALVLLLLLFRRRLLSVLASVLRRFVSEGRTLSIRAAVAAGARILLRPRRLALAVTLSFAVWGIVGLSIWALLPAFGLEDVDPLVPWLILVANSFALTIPSSSGAVGVYEASVQAALVAFGVSASTALSYGLLLHAVNFFPIIVIGAAASWAMSRAPSRRR
jgi:glycosyltransferase 2 family protein